MSTYLLGDIHGCYDELKIILSQVQFYPSTDTLWITGDLIARGPNSLDVLRLIRSLDNSVRLVLGNHDLNLLAVHAGIIYNKPKDNITALLEAPDIDELINWLRYQPLIQVDKKKKLIMTHAGIYPKWDLATAMQCAKEVEYMLKSKSYHSFLNSIMYNRTPSTNNWSSNLNNLARLHFSVNAFTRMRYCFPNGKLDMKCKEIPDKAPAPLKPWFTMPNLLSKHYNIVFGHWASIMGKGTPKHIYGLDTGCCWGGELTLLSWEDKVFVRTPSLIKKQLN